MKSVREIADAVHATLEGDPAVMISRVASMENARSGDLTFLMRDRVAPSRDRLHASAIIVPREVGAEKFPAGVALLRADDPHLAFAEALDLLHPRRSHPFSGISPGAAIDPQATIGEGAAIAAGCTVAAGCRIGRRVTLYPGVYVGPGCELGDDCVLHPNVTLYERCSIGARCILHAGSVVGREGFGFVLGSAGPRKIQHLGAVRIEDDVEIGANCTIDRGALDDTVIGQGSKLDNLVHIAHNCVLGRHCMIAAQTGLAGSATLGDGVLVGGQAGIAGHIRVGNRVQVAGKSGVYTDVADGERVFGYPAGKHLQAWRAYSLLFHLPVLWKQVAELRRTLGLGNGGAEGDGGEGAGGDASGGSHAGDNNARRG